MIWGVSSTADKCGICMDGYVKSEVGRCVEDKTRDVDSNCEKADPQGWCLECKEN